ncbi:MAG: S1/P1 nuclease [Paludibacter sp.]|nr:S1/P1 nuclease [Bacteroidales bacterium]MCM1069115.1 S1/P1 nuclease [Prevotella sp.]MCM1353554.1 S1/P1 nuclease [Bacteroides sp.]MCM1442715.1 S1/P1 nuclease [Muribaculum sp.]MCM1481649.1 S1/P1 nuclease [Paludibacter sp.]
MKRNLLIVLSALLVCSNAFAWDAVGHRIVTEIAYRNLNKKVVRAVDDVLGKRGIVYCSSWADEIKSDTIYPDSYGWHFQNLRAGMTREDLLYLWENPTSEGIHLFYALDSLTNVLRNDPKNADALKFVVHLAGDMFQPMHMGHPEDRGGNKVQMRWFGKGTNLHSLWDRWLIDNTQYSYSEYVNYLTDKYASETKTLQQMSLFECVCTTYERQQRIYAWQDKGDTNNYHYAYNFRTDLDLSLYTAGIKLAQLLNELYK